MEWSNVGSGGWLEFDEAEGSAKQIEYSNASKRINGSRDANGA